MTSEKLFLSIVGIVVVAIVIWELKPGSNLAMQAVASTTPPVAPAVMSGLSYLTANYPSGYAFAPPVNMFAATSQYRPPAGVDTPVSVTQSSIAADERLGQS